MIENINMEQVKQVLILVGALAVMWLFFVAFQKYNAVKKSVGWKFVESLGKVKGSLGENDLVLEITSQSGKRTFIPVKQTTIINYEVRQKGKDVKKAVIYDERAVEYLNGIPILKCTPNDIRPIDRETGVLVNIPSEIVDKLIVDSSKTAEGEAKKDKQFKMVLIILGVTLVLFFVAITYINQTNAEIQTELMKCTLELGKSVTVIGE